MKPKDILIATALILFISSLLSGCVEGGKLNAIKQSDIQNIIHKAASVKKEVSLTLKAQRDGEKIRVSIVLENPNQKPVTSIQSWLSFDTAKLQGVTMDTTGSAFSMVAPYNNTFDNQNGLVMLGRANPIPVVDKSAKVADLVFDIVKTGTTMLDIYDYREDLSGHASVNTLVDSRPYNILIKPQSPLLIIQ